MYHKKIDFVFQITVTLILLMTVIKNIEACYMFDMCIFK